MNDDSREERIEPSRTAKKRAAQAVEDLAARLADLAAADFRRLPLEGELRWELEAARSIKAHGARKRQIKHLAGLLRRDDENRDAAEAFLASLDLGRHQDAERFHLLEKMRERLCDPARREAALDEIRQTLPALDAAKVRRLAEAVELNGDKRAFRELFRMLKAEM